MFIDDAQILSNPGVHGATEKCVTLEVSKVSPAPPSPVFDGQEGDGAWLAGCAFVYSGHVPSLGRRVLRGHLQVLLIP